MAKTAMERDVAAALIRLLLPGSRLGDVAACSEASSAPGATIFTHALRRRLADV